MLNTEELHAHHLKHSPLARIHEALELHECHMCGSSKGLLYDSGPGLNSSMYCP